MSIAGLALPDVIGAVVGFILTLAVFTYVIGDNVLFRMSIHLFIGAAAGYAAVIAITSVIWPQLVLPLLTGTPTERLFALVPLVLSISLILKVAPSVARLGNPAMAYLVGVGVAAAIGGAVMGTIFPQVAASTNLFDLSALQGDSGWVWAVLKGSIVLVGTITTLVYFHYGARPKLNQTAQRPVWIEWLAWVGQIFIAITLGSIFAGVYSAALSALVERLHFISSMLAAFLP